jgi:hypothetical protein
VAQFVVFAHAVVHQRHVGHQLRMRDRHRRSGVQFVVQLVAQRMLGQLAGGGVFGRRHEERACDVRYALCSRAGRRGRVTHFTRAVGAAPFGR